jgi:periplasmic divalent cation tolerance protein
VTVDHRSSVVLILTTAPGDGDLAERIANALIEERLAACVNVGAPMTSVYRWRGALEHDIERPLVIKTAAALVEAVRARIGELHSYELPEFLVISVSEGSAPYLDWVLSETRPHEG